MKKADAVVIGFGKGGKTLAGALAEAGRSVIMVERSDKMYGGTCINVACIPTKSLVHSAALSAAMGGSFAEKAERYAAAIFEKDRLTGALRGKNYHKLADHPNVTVLTGDGSFLDARHVAVAMADGSRVLLFAACQPGPNGRGISSPLPLAFVLLRNPLREHAKETFAYFHAQGVTVKVISGDNPVTVSAAAREAGIEGADRYVDASTLETYEDIEAACEEYNVFGRVKPNQKKLLIQALQSNKHTVAMTGDGVNDVLALKEADCSVAMASGSDVAAQISDLVLMNSDFSSMPSVVAEGRRVINNIERAASLYLVKNIFSLILAVISITAVFSYPLSPSQLTLMSLLSIGIPSLILALEPNENLVSGKFLRNAIVRALPAAFTDLFIIIFVLLFQQAFQISNNEISTITALLVTIVGFFMVWRVAKPVNRLHLGMMGGLILALLFIIAVIPGLFSLSPLSFGGILVLTVFILLIPSVIWLLNKALEGLSLLFHKASGGKYTA